jgi:alpha-galactosidase
MNIQIRHIAIGVVTLLLAGMHGSAFPIGDQQVRNARADRTHIPHAGNSVLPADKLRIQGENLRVEFDHNLCTRVIARFGGQEIPVSGFSASEQVQTPTGAHREFAFKAGRRERVEDEIGQGEQLTVSGVSSGLMKTVSVTIYDEFPTMAIFEVTYTNLGKAEIRITSWTNNAYTLEAQPRGSSPAFWSYQSASYEKRPDWVLPLHPGFRQENYLGMNASDYGGGTPVVDVWRKDIGIAVGHIEKHPKLISLPVSMMDASHARLAVQSSEVRVLQPGEAFSTLRTFVAVHRGDYFQTLATYRQLMGRQGFRSAVAPESAFGPIWCAWGYGRTFEPKQIYDTLPVVKKMGFTWVTIDDGWQDTYGDWGLNRQKFPNGDADMKALVDRIHQEGFRAQLWWSPMSAVLDSKLLKDHPDMLLKNRDQSNRKISWWDSYYLCPADRRVVEYHKALVRKILGEWGFDGLKLDGQFMNAAPRCYNPAHHHARPEESIEAVPEFFRELYETAKQVKPDALVEFCPCGTSYSFFTMPHYDMSVASDPTSSFQVRSKGKTLKALMGDGAAYFGDHVELSDGGNDFASTVGVGGVVGTQFVLPELAEKHGKSDLTPERMQHFEKWLAIYREKMLSRGEYLGALYDIGFDRPEAHAIRKDGKMYYAFYAKTWKGPIELRGLENQRYRVMDYVSGKDLGTVQGPSARLDTQFAKHLLLEARPE